MDPERLRRIARLCGLLGGLFVLGCGEARGDPAVRVLVQSSPLAGFRYHEAADLWDLLRVGDLLELRRETDNPHDAYAVAVWWRGRKLGYVPRRENKALAWGIDQGEQVGARISRLTAHPNPARRIEVEVYAE
jgi:hypothetical protein